MARVIKKRELEKQAKQMASKFERERRRAMINNGTWMGRSAVFKSKAAYDRQRAARETRRELRDA